MCLALTAIKKQQVKRDHLIVFVRGGQKKATRRIRHLRDLDCEGGMLLNRNEKTEGIFSNTWKIGEMFRQLLQKVKEWTFSEDKNKKQWRRTRNHRFKLQQERLIFIRKKNLGASGKYLPASCQGQVMQIFTRNAVLVLILGPKFSQGPFQPYCLTSMITYNQMQIWQEKLANGGQPS